MIFIYLLSFSPYVLRNNCVIETHEKYVIASYEHRKVLIYTDEIYFENEGIRTNASIVPIESNSNFQSFDFSEFCRRQNIDGMINENEVEFIKKDSLKRKMYQKIETYDESAVAYLKKVFYQFDTDDLILSSGLHLSTINNSMKKMFSLIFDVAFSKILASMVCLLFGILFPYKFSFLRIISGNAVSILFKKYSKKDQIGIQYLICMLLSPTSCFSLSFILPFFLSIIQLFSHEKKHRYFCNQLFLFFFQFYTFGCCRPFSIVFFSFIRWLNAVSLFISFALFALPVSSFYSFLMRIIERCMILLNAWVFYGKSPLIITLLFVVFFIAYWNHKMDKCITCCVLLACIPMQAYLNPCYTITFLNVGQGDSIYIQSPFNISNILIDIPKNEDDTVIEYLHNHGINRIDTLVFTHEDSDHNGGKESFIHSFKVKNIIEDDKNIALMHLPIYSLNPKNENKEDNDNSLVYYFKLGNLYYLLMGDASVEVEKEILNNYELKCDVLKVGHHGSKTSTSAVFLQMLQPKVSIISVGKHNRYHHPNDEVIQLLKNYEIQTYLTSINGAISIKSFLNFNFITTSSNEFGIITNGEIQ